MLKISSLSIEKLKLDCVTDNPKPRIAFALNGEQGAKMAEAVISLNGWLIKTTAQNGIFYDGVPLSPFTEYEVNVTVKDNHGESASASMKFETGRLGKPWQADWISDTSYNFTEKHTSPRPMTFRKRFECGKEVKSARLYVTALGIYEFMLNGKKVGNDYFAPGFTSYRHQLQYQTYDITDMLQKDNEAVVIVGGGWAVGAFTYKLRNRVYAKRQALLCEMRITYNDGSVEVIGSDESWKVTLDGSYQMTDFYNGEIYDARVSLADSKYHNAGRENVSLKPNIIAQYGAPVRAHEKIVPISCYKGEDGSLIYDFGQNFAGVIHANINGMEGQKIVFRHAEVLMDGNLFTEPLRTAKQEAVYYCIDGKQQYSPRMTYMGFRYVSVSGIAAEDIQLSAYALYSDVEENGSFSCSNEMLNKLQSNIRWGAKSNIIDIPTDCPQRDERMGWTGDIALFAPTAAYNFDTGRFLEKWLLDVKAEQNKGGGIPVTVPLVRVPLQWEIMIPMAVDHWGDACIWVPWAEYIARGDVSLLEKMYPTMKLYVKACLFWSGLFSSGNQKYIWSLLHHYGDWCAPEQGMWDWMRRGKWTATAALSRSSATLAQIAEILGNSDDAAYYRSISEKVNKAYRSVLMDEDCKLKDEFQTGYVLPLYYNMLSNEDARKAAGHLASLVREGGYHIKTGFPGTPYILFALADNGYVEDAYKMLLTDTCPSWLYMVKTGGTTIWERWDALREDGTCNTGADDGTGGMVSFNHYASGAVGDFFYRRILGLEPIEAGYRSFRIAPVLGRKITWAQGTLNTPYGKIKIRWEITDSLFSINTTVPMGTQCTLILPDSQTIKLAHGEHSLQCECEVR